MRKNSFQKLCFWLGQLFKSSALVFFAFLGGKQTCIICNKGTYVLPVCSCCRKKFFYSRFNSPSFYGNRCTICGRPLISTKDSCPSCRENRVIKNIDRALPLFSYRLWNKELLFLWKIQEIRALSYFFAFICQIGLKNLGIKYLVPVPPRPGKIQKKGWDQIDELCTFLSMFYGFCLLNILERRSDLEQKKLGRLERYEQSEMSYRLKNPEQVMKELKKCGGSFPEQVCIIDDVCTTGATIEACASILRKHTQIKNITSMTLFIV